MTRAKNKALYSKDEIIEMAKAYAGIVYAKVIVDSLNPRVNPKRNAAVLRNILENTIPHYGRTVPTRIAQKLENLGIIDLKNKCEGLLAKL